MPQSNPGFVPVEGNTIIEKIVAEGNRDPFTEADYKHLADAVKHHKVRVVMGKHTMDIIPQDKYVLIKPTSGEMLPRCSLEVERLFREYGE